MHRHIFSTRQAQSIGALLLTVAMLLPLFPSTTNATSPSLTANETVANVTIKSVPTITTAGGVTEVKATRTITVGAAPANAETIVIGLCTVTFTTTAGSTADDVNCTGGATIDTNTGVGDVVRTASDVAGILRTLTNVTDTGHGALTVTGATTNAIFTTTGTEAAATVITFTDGTTGDITSTASTTGVIPVAATVTIVITDGLVAASADQSVNIDGLGAIALGAVVQTAAEVAATIRAGITGAGGYAAKDYAVTGAGANIIFTRESTGAAGNAAITITDGDYGSKAQIVTFTPADLTGSEKLRVTINGTNYDHSWASTVQAGVEGLVAALATDADVTCTEDNAMVTCTADTAGTAFTYAASATSASSGGSGGGGGSSSSNDDDDEPASTPSTLAGLQTMLNSLLAQLAALKGESTPASVSGSFSADLDLGANGADVSKLQAWLIAKGYAIPAGATGYFGAQTQSALAAYQKAKGITPAVGFFGPKTRASVNAGS